MAFEHIDRFIDLFVVGATLLLVGGGQLLLPGAGLAKRAAASAVATGAVFAASVALLETSKFLGHAAAIVLPLLVLYHLLGSAALRRLATAAMQFAGQSAVRSTGLLLAGLTVAIGSAVSYDRSDEIEVDRGMHAMEVLSYRPPTALDTSVRATTDRNRPIPLNKPIQPRDANAIERDEVQFLEASNRITQ